MSWCYRSSTVSIPSPSFFLGRSISRVAGARTTSDGTVKATSTKVWRRRMLIVQPSPIASVVQRVVEIEGPRRALGAPEIGDEVFGSACSR